MILVTLGTQDKSFKRLLSAIQNAIDNKEITDKVIVQAGCTKFTSADMEIFDLIPVKEFKKLVQKCDILITHGGVGSILTGLQNHKKVIVAPRLAKYQEHTNDHQLQIVKEFTTKGLIKEIVDFNKIGEVVKSMQDFKPQKFTSNTKNMVNLIDDYIQRNTL